MADPKVAMRESGYVASGGISPLGQRTKHTTVLDESAMEFSEILIVGGGKRGLSLGGVNPRDLVQVLDAVVAPIGTTEEIILSAAPSGSTKCMFLNRLDCADLSEP